MRVGIVGLATTYYPLAIGRALKADRRVKLLAAATLGATDKAIRQYTRMSAAECASELGVGLYRDPEEMVAAEKLDTVVVCTRHTQHARWAERMAALGMNIYIPKTFATTLAAAERIVRAGRRHRVKIAVGPTGRDLPLNAACQAAVKRGRIGEPFAARVCHHHGTIDGFGADDWYRDSREGGPELSLGWYVIDIVLDAIGPDVANVYAQYDNYTTPGSPFMDCGKIILRTKSGAMASCDLYFCNRVPYPMWEMEIVGPRGVVKVHSDDVGAGGVTASLFTSRGATALKPPRGLPKAWELAWVDSFLGTERADLLAEHAMLVTKICLAARDSARRGRAVRVQ